jgi:sulfate transporter 3
MMQEGAAVARSYAMAKNYHVDGNKEMITFGAMNMTGSCSSCYLTAGPFSRSAVNRDSGCRTAVSNAVMAAVVALTLLFLTPLFRHTPQASLSAIIFSAMLVNVDLPAAARLWRVDNPDFFVCLGAFLGVVFGSVELGLCVAVGAPGPAARREAEDDGAREDAGLGGVPADGPVRRCRGCSCCASTRPSTWPTRANCCWK